MESTFFRRIWTGFRSKFDWLIYQFVKCVANLRNAWKKYTIRNPYGRMGHRSMEEFAQCSPNKYANMVSKTCISPKLCHNHYRNSSPLAGFCLVAWSLNTLSCFYGCILVQISDVQFKRLTVLAGGGGIYSRLSRQDSFMYMHHYNIVIQRKEKSEYSKAHI